MKQALRLFNRLADRRDMVFENINDKCYARAHLIALQMEREGYTPRKAWAVKGGKSFPHRYFDFHTAGGKKLKWCYHVAAALPVKQADGTVEDMIFDPALFDGPATLREWGRAMQVQPRNLSIVGLHQFPPGYSGNYTPASRIRHDNEREARESLQEAREEVRPGTRRLRTVFASAARLEVVGADAPDSAFHGRTWQTKAYKSRHPSFAM